ncbi:hypothetical protein [Ascidiimonas sp. W6]|uniref:hypothetical protein n=1 Tax=Ascidiimonas meishanensis TaxID=3128903 RepID=UPI0030EC177A
MNNLTAVIEKMSNEQRHRFIIYQKQKNRRSDTHNIQLFKLIASDKGKKITSEKIYGEENSAAFNALKKRLFDSLIEFIAVEGFDNDATNEMELLRLLLAARILLKQQQYKTAFKLLNKTILKAELLELYGLATEAYHTYIEYLHKDSSDNGQHIFLKAQKNIEKFKEAETLHMNFSLLRKLLSKNQNESIPANLSSLLESLFTNSFTSQHSLTYKSLCQLMDISNEYASLYQNFHSITPFMEKSYASISKKESLSEHHLYYHIQVIYFMANLYFRNREFSTSLHWLSKMQLLMQQKNATYQNRFLLKYTLLKTLNLHYANQTKEAISVSEETLKTILKPDIGDHYNLLLALAMYYFNINELKKAMAIFRIWNKTDSWYEERLGKEWTLKKNLFEIILHIEIENSEYALTRIKSFKRRYRTYFEKVEAKNAFVFLKLIEQHIKYPENTRSEKFITNAEKSIAWKEQNQEDIFVMSFYAWLKSKMTGKSLPEVLQNLVQS